MILLHESCLMSPSRGGKDRISLNQRGKKFKKPPIYIGKE